MHGTHHLLICAAVGRPDARELPAIIERINRSSHSAMSDFLREFAGTLQTSRLHDGMVYLLTNIPGFPPIIQTVHIAAIAVVMGSIVLISMRALGLAFPYQQAGEMARRLMPWMWWALPVLLISGLVFVLARPRRYFVNPVFGLKFALLLPAIICAWFLHRLVMREPDVENAELRQRILIRSVAALSLLLWLSVALAGRWIAYADYLFPPE